MSGVDHERDLKLLCQLRDRKNTLVIRAVSLFQRVELDCFEVVVFHGIF